MEFLTGLLSYAAYNPLLSGGDPNPAHGIFGFYLFTWGTAPPWAYHAVESVHVILGLALVPVVLGKLWSVAPKLFRWPPVRSPAHLLERLSLLLLVGGAIFQGTTGILNIDYFGIERFSFYTGHFFGAWVFMAAFVTHAILKWSTMVGALRTRRLATELRTGLAGTSPELDGGVAVATSLAPSEAAASIGEDSTPPFSGETTPPVRDELSAEGTPTITRRGVLAVVGASSLAVVVFTAGEAVGGPLRPLALFGTRQQTGDGPTTSLWNHGLAVGITAAATGSGLAVAGRRPARRHAQPGDLLHLPLTTSDISLTCTEGWSTTQRWTGVPLADLAAMVGISQATGAQVESLEGGATTLVGAQARSGALVALQVNGVDLSADHGYPARLIIPSAPGTTNRKWLTRLTFFGERGHG